MIKKTVLLALLSMLSIHGITQNLDSLLNAWQDKTQPKSDRVEAYKDYIWNGYLFSQPDTAEVLLEALHTFAKNHQYLKASAIGYNLQGIANAVQGNYPIALEYYKKSLAIEEKTENKLGVAASLNNIGMIYDEQGNYPIALEYHQKSLAIREKLGDKNGIATSLINIGNIYANQGNYPQALEYYHKNLAINEELGDNLSIANSLDNIGLICSEQGNYSSALEYHQKSLAIDEVLGNKNGIANSLGNIGNIYAHQGNYPNALEYFQKSLAIREEIGDKNGIALSLGNIGVLYQKQGMHTLAIDYCQKGLTTAKHIGALDWQKLACKCLYKTYKDIGKGNEALKFYEQMNVLKDSMFNEENTKKLTRLEMQYEYDKKEVLAKAEQEKKDILTKEQIKRKDHERNGVMIGLGLVLIFTGFLYNRFKVTQKQKNIIEEKERETHVQKEIIEEKHKEITDSINYAERIQRSFLATKELLNENLGDYFVFFKPKDVVSGDFYWAGRLNNGNFALCCADSTGHGVPGAIMSILNISSIEKSIEKENKPNYILFKTREIIIERLKNDGSPEGGRDGMDCSLLVLNKDKTHLSFASAQNPVFIIRNDELIEFKGDKMPIGKHDRDQEPFTLQSIELTKGDIIYTLTDGFPDQFGGEKGKKYMIKNLKNLFLSIANLSMTEQKQKLEEEFIRWKGDLEQVDDVCIIGVRI